MALHVRMGFSNKNEMMNDVMSGSLFAHSSLQFNTGSLGKHAVISDT